MLLIHNNASLMTSFKNVPEHFFFIRRWKSSKSIADPRSTWVVTFAAGGIEPVFSTTYTTRMTSTTTSLSVKTMQKIRMRIEPDQTRSKPVIEPFINGYKQICFPGAIFTKQLTQIRRFLLLSNLLNMIMSGLVKYLS